VSARIVDVGEARRLAMTASIPAVSLPDSAAVLRHLGLLQLDPMTRVDKAHRLTCLPRMPAQSTADDIDGPLWSDGAATAFEAWVHAVCLLPAEDWPLLRLSRERARASPGRAPASVLQDVRAIVAAHPAGAIISDIEQPGAATKGWDWSARKHAAEHMLRTGELICSARRGGKRVLDLPERRLPARLLDAHPSREEILAALATKALTAMGIATAADVATHYNLTRAAASEGLQIAGAQPVTVAGWDAQAWTLRGSAEARAAWPREPVLIGPFDNLIWDRGRVRRVFGFDYLFEAYKPPAQRKFGCYVLALLASGQFLGRADMRRDGSTLHVIAQHPEAGTDPAEFTAALDTATQQLQRRLHTEPRRRGC
jgi:uncharacterized protein YcaQ